MDPHQVFLSLHTALCKQTTFQTSRDKRTIKACCYCAIHRMSAKFLVSLLICFLPQSVLEPWATAVLFFARVTCLQHHSCMWNFSAFYILLLVSHLPVAAMVLVCTACLTPVELPLWSWWPKTPQISTILT